MPEVLYVCGLCSIRLAYEVCLFVESGAEIPSCTKCVFDATLEGIDVVTFEIPEGFEWRN